MTSPQLHGAQAQKSEVGAYHSLFNARYVLGAPSECIPSPHCKIMHCAALLTYLLPSKTSQPHKGAGQNRRHTSRVPPPPGPIRRENSTHDASATACTSHYARHDIRTEIGRLHSAERSLRWWLWQCLEPPGKKNRAL
jgi:hypothetical protein